MRIKFQKHHRGASLIEVVCAMVIVSVGMGGIYVGLMTASRDMFEPEITFEAMNMVSFYQDKISDLQLLDCERADLILIEKNLCEPLKETKMMMIDLKKAFPWEGDKSLEVKISLLQPSPLLYQIDYHLMAGKETLLRSTQWKSL